MTLRASDIATLASALERVRRFDTPADNGLSAFFRSHPNVGQRDRAFVADALGGKSGLQRDEIHGLHSAMD